MWSVVAPTAAAACLLLAACGNDIKTTVRNSDTLYLLPLGDSITQADRHHQSYRYPLWAALKGSDTKIDFVGSLTRHSGGKGPDFPDVDGDEFDRDHEGYWGLRADELLAMLPERLPHYPVDIALVHLGTNDVLHGQPIASTISELEQIIDLLRQKNPAVAVLLARPGTSNWPNAKALPELADQVSVLSEKLDQPNARVIAVPVDAVLTTSATYDGLHPNADGEALIASAFFNAMVANQLIQP